MFSFLTDKLMNFYFYSNTKICDINIAFYIIDRFKSKVKHCYASVVHRITITILRIIIKIP